MIQPDLDLISHDLGIKLGLRGSVCDATDKNPWSAPLLPVELRRDPEMTHYAHRWYQGLREGYAAAA